MLVSKWDQDLRLNDSYWYSGQAVKLADGDGFVDFFYGGPTAEHGPLTPLLLAPVSWMDDPVRWQRTVMTVVGIAVVVAVALLARRVGGWWAGVVAAGLAAIYPNLWMNDSLVMSEAPAALLVVVALWLALDLVDGDRAAFVARSLACGAAIGLAALTRSELVLLVPLLAIVVWRTSPAAVRRESDSHRRAVVLWHGRRARAVGRRESRALRAAGAADHQRWHHVVRRQLR